MSAASGWNFEGVENGFEMFIAEIGNRHDDEIGRALDQAYHDFAGVESILYLRAENTAEQRELVERLGLDWAPVDMPWLLVLEDHPYQVEVGDRALCFRLGDLDSADQVRDVTRTLMRVSSEDDFINELNWERRKEKCKEMIPVLKETLELVISIVGTGLR